MTKPEPTTKMTAIQPRTLLNVEIFGSAVAAPLGTTDLPGNWTIEIGRYVIVFQCLDPGLYSVLQYLMF